MKRTFALTALLSFGLATSAGGMVMLDPIFNGKDLSGWKEIGGGKNV